MFNKYDTYARADSIYCYKGTDVLKNKFGIRTQEELKIAETELTSIRQYAMIASPIPGRFTKAHLCRIHRFLFQDIYPFAGRFRKEQIAKGDTWFYPADLIERELDKLFDFIRQHDKLRHLNEADFFDQLSYIMAELNIIHPFREGNGRAIREFIRLLALYNDYTLNWGNIEKEKILESSILSVDDYRVLIPVLVSCSAR